MIIGRRKLLATSAIAPMACPLTTLSKAATPPDRTPEQLYNDLITKHNFTGHLALRFAGGGYIHPAQSGDPRIALVVEKYFWFLQPFAVGFQISDLDQTVFWDSLGPDILLRPVNHTAGRQTFVFEGGIISAGELSVKIRFYVEGTPGIIHTGVGIYLGVVENSVVRKFDVNGASRFIAELAPGRLP
jgi:hypothetical protein